MLSRTAAFVRTSGAQSEIVLRVRHSGNACFAFLEPQHRLHAFYVHLRDADPEARQRAARASLQLLSDYGEEEEEEEEPAATIEQPTDVVPEAADAPPPEERAPEPLASRAELPVEMAAAMDRVVWAALRGGAAIGVGIGAETGDGAATCTIGAGGGTAGARRGVTWAGNEEKAWAGGCRTGAGDTPLRP